MAWRFNPVGGNGPHFSGNQLSLASAGCGLTMKLE
jgi:hypothetical protein